MQLPWLPQGCHQCAMPLEITLAGVAVHCGACLSIPPHYHNTLAPFYYANPVKSVIRTFKFGHSFYCAPFLREALMLTITKHYQNQPLPQVLMPIPLHSKRLRQRGFNQALEIGKQIGRKLNIPIDTKSCQRLKNNSPQSMLDSKTRRAQKLKWTLSKDFDYQHVAIIDDVMTTGTTVNSLAKILRKQGVKQIDVWVCARTL